MNQHSEETKRCCTCKELKPLSKFYRLKSSPDGRYPNCIKCYRALRAPRMDRIRHGRRMWEHRIRKEVIKHYGGECACCGERHFEFLAIDHIDGGGRKHRKKINTPLPYWLRKNGFPPGFRILCHNCNMAIGRYGYCPHNQAML